MVQFQLLEPNAPIPSGYHLATTQDVENNKQDLFKAMPGWEIANLANGSVDGASYGGNVRGDIRNDVTRRLAVSDSSQPTTFELFDTNDDLPQGYRLATVQDVQANPQALRKAMPGYEIANLADGSVDGASYGCNIRNETRSDVSQKLVVPENASRPPLKFQLFNVGDQLPPFYRLATRHEVESNRQAFFEAMPGTEVAYLADGSVEGAVYGGRTSAVQRNDVTHKLAVQEMWIS